MIRLGPIARNEACRQLTQDAAGAFLVGSTNPAQVIEIYERPAGGTGPKPDPLPSGVESGAASDPAVTSGCTKLAELPWNAGEVASPFNPCNSVGGNPATQPARVGTAYANDIDPDTAVAATGTAQYFRILNRRDGTTNERFIMDGDITPEGGGGDIEFDDVNFVAGGTAIITDLALIIPITCPQDQDPPG